jgi:hypothetical protein
MLKKYHKYPDLLRCSIVVDKMNKDLFLFTSFFLDKNYPNEYFKISVKNETGG